MSATNSQMSRADLLAFTDHRTDESMSQQSLFSMISEETIF